MRVWMIAPLGIAVMVAACGETRTQRAATGATGGAVAGAVVGGPVGALVGAGVGATGGAYRETIEDKSDTFVDNKADALARDRATNADNMQHASAPSDLTNAEVTDAQRRLKEMGFYNGRVDGLYGPRTISAVGAFQQKQNLPQTFALDDRTMAALEQHARDSQAGDPAQSAATGAQRSVTSQRNAAEASQAAETQNQRANGANQSATDTPQGNR